MRGREYKSRLFKMHLKLRDQQYKIITCVFVCVCVCVCVCVYGNSKPKIYNRYTHRKEKGIQT